MKVNFDNLRYNIVADFNAIVKVLNDNIGVPPSAIKDHMDSLRMAIVTLAYLYEPGEFESLDDVEVNVFNPDDDE